MGLLFKIEWNFYFWFSVLILGLNNPVNGFPSGGPSKSCANLYPKHKTNAQLSDSPYVIDVSPLNYSPGDDVTVTLSGKSGAQFKGFMLRANRLLGDTEELVGQFTNTPENTKAKFWYPENENTTNCVTHASSDLKDSVALNWKAPDVTAGDIQFYGCFVKDFETFWVMVPSAVVSATVAVEQKPFNANISQNFKPINFGECGVTKGCMLYPSYCTGYNCDVAVTFMAHEKGIDFEVEANAVGYLTFAISEDDHMGTDETVTCIIKDEYVSVQHGFNPAYYNDRHRIVNFTNIEASRHDNKVMCRWTMPYVNTLTHLVEAYQKPLVVKKYTFDLREPWRLFLAWGDIYEGADVLGKHKELPVISIGKVNLLKNKVVRANGLNVMVKVHGILMVVGFMTLISCGVIISRYFRDIFHKQLMSTKVWFQLHRGVMIGASLYIVVSFILIFVKLQKWSTANSTHALLGTLTTGFMILNILGGLLRPGTDSSIRPAFNWFHRIGGKITQVLSAITMILCLFTTYFNENLKQCLAVAIGVWIVGQILWELVVFELYQCTHPDQDVSTADDMDMKEMESLNRGNKTEKSTKSKNPTLMYILFAFYCLFILAVTTASISIILMY